MFAFAQNKYNVLNRVLRWGEIPVLSFGRITRLPCCGIAELNQFQWYDQEGREYTRNLQEAFNGFIRGPDLDVDTTPAYRMMVLNRPIGAQHANQPRWLVRCLENFPGAVDMGWMRNNNTKTSDIRVFMLPREQT